MRKETRVTKMSRSSIEKDARHRKSPSEQVVDLGLASPSKWPNQAERNFRMEKARRLYDVLPPEERKMLEMAFFDGLTRSKIAEITGVPLGTVNKGSEARSER